MQVPHPSPKQKFNRHIAIRHLSPMERKGSGERFAPCRGGTNTSRRLAPTSRLLPCSHVYRRVCEEHSVVDNECVRHPRLRNSEGHDIAGNHKKKIEFVVLYAASQSPSLMTQLSGLHGELIAHINDLKNNTMYVSCKQGGVLTPEEVVSSLPVSTHVNVAEYLANLANSLSNNKFCGSLQLQLISDSAPDTR